ncbi:MAG: transcriptional regulator [Alphaproteobacteria bacterium]|nr:transcriptional regulator [Alphaproteobacteria bacterium]
MPHESAISQLEKAAVAIMEGGKAGLFRGDRKILLRHDLDAQFKKWRGLGPAAARPHGGWLRAVREALGMSTRQLGRRLETCSSAVTRLEQSEAAGTIHLASLERAAEALGCKVVYALVPEKGSLHETLARRRRELAQKLYRRQHGGRRFTAAETAVISSLCGDSVHARRVWD